MQLKNNISIVIFTCLSILSFPVFGKSHLKNGNSYAQVVNGSVQRTMPGMKGMAPYDQYTFTLVWKSVHTPSMFYWKGDDKWMKCRVAILSKHSEEIVKKGDTIMLSPIRNGQDVIPEQVLKSNTTSLVLTTSKNEWLYIPVKKIDKKPVLIMP